MAELNERQQQEIAARRQIADTLIEKGDYSGAIKAALGTTADIQVQFGTRQSSILNELSSKQVDKLVPANTRTVVDAVLTPIAEGAVAAKGNPKINITVKDAEGNRTSLYTQDKQGQVLVNEAYPSAETEKKLETAQKVEPAGQTVTREPDTVKPVAESNAPTVDTVIESKTAIEPGSLATIEPATLTVDSNTAELNQQVRNLLQQIDVLKASATAIGKTLEVSPSADTALSQIKTDLTIVQQEANQLRSATDNIATAGEDLVTMTADAKQFEKALKFVETKTKQASPSAKWAFSKVTEGLNTFKAKATQLKKQAEPIRAAAAQKLETLKGKASEAKEKYQSITEAVGQKVESAQVHTDKLKDTVQAKLGEAQAGIQTIKADTVRDFKILQGLVGDAEATIKTLKKDGKEKLSNSRIKLEDKALGTVKAATNWVNKHTANVSNKMIAKAAMQAVSRGEQRIQTNSYIANDHTISETNVPGRYKLTDAEQYTVLYFDVNKAGEITRTQQGSDYNFVSVKQALNAEVVRTSNPEIEKMHDQGSAAVAQTARAFLEHSAQLDGSVPSTDPGVRASHKGKTYTYALSKDNTLTIKHNERGEVLRQESDKTAVSNLSKEDFTALKPAVENYQQSQQSTEQNRETVAVR